MQLRHLLLILIILLVACSEKPEDSVRFGLASMPSNLDPRYATDAASSRIDRLLYQRLVDFDDAKRAIPSIADWKRISEKHFQFVLNNKVKTFTDGTTLTASDVKATYDFILDKKNASPHRAALSVVDHIATLDDKTIDFYLNKPDPLFPGYLVVGILPAEKLAAKHDFSKSPLGSGDFMFVSKAEDRIRIQRRSDKLYVDFIHVPNPTVRVLKLMRGEIDIVQNDLLPELIKYLESDKDIVVRRKNGSNFAYIGFNMQDPILKHKNIRQAIAYGLDRQEIIKYVFADSARKALSILPPDHWAGNRHLQGFSFNPEKAKALLAEAGYSPEKPLELTYKTSSDPFRLRLATIYQHQLQKIGIKLDIRSYDWGTFYGDIKNGHFQLYSLAWIGIKTPDIFKYTSHSDAIPPNGANRGHYKNPEIDALIDKALVQQDLNKQAEYYAQIQALLLEDLPYIPLWYEDNILLTRKHIKHYQIAADGNYDGLKTVTM
ncbi:MAG: ABC transporter substrate-binding protein [Gammaproteobacteria bacterium]|nr:ABC transporter substrate-binding protein [Gammaproteobacteria bacterium]